MWLSLRIRYVAWMEKNFAKQNIELSRAIKLETLNHFHMSRKWTELTRRWMKWYEAVRKQDSQKKTKRREKGIKKTHKVLSKRCLFSAWAQAKPLILMHQEQLAQMKPWYHLLYKEHRTSSAVYRSWVIDPCSYIKTLELELDLFNTWSNSTAWTKTSPACTCEHVYEWAKFSCDNRERVSQGKVWGQNESCNQSLEATYNVGHWGRWGETKVGREDTWLTSSSMQGGKTWSLSQVFWTHHR